MIWTLLPLIWVGGMALAFPVTAHMVHRHNWSKEGGIIAMTFWPFTGLYLIAYAILLGMAVLLVWMGDLYNLTERIWNRPTQEDSTDDEPDSEDSGDSEGPSEEKAQEEEELDSRVNARAPKRGLPN